MSAPILISQLSKVYSQGKAELEVRAIDRISFSVERGESLGIIGPSGRFNHQGYEVMTAGDGCTGCASCAVMCPDTAIRVFRTVRKAGGGDA